MTKNQNSANSRWWMTAILKIVFWLYLNNLLSDECPRLQNDLYCVEWDVKLYYTIPYKLMRNLVRRSRITLRHRPHDQNTKFHKFKMADGHFENGFIATSQPRIIQIRQNLICNVNFNSKNGHMTKNKNFANIPQNTHPLKYVKRCHFWFITKTLANEIATFINSSEPSCHVTRSFGRDNHRHHHCSITKILILSLTLNDINGNFGRFS